MGRPLRAALGGFVYHVLNRGNARLPIFNKHGDYEAFERILGEALEHVPGMRLLAYCLMPNHWHLVVWPRKDGELSDFGHWLTLTHTQRWHAHYRDVGCGHLYQGRFKSFPVQADEHFLAVCRYVERNALRANLVKKAEAWRYGSLWRRQQSADAPRADAPLLSAWPVPCPRDWVAAVNRVETEAELEAMRRCVQRGRPYGDEGWSKRTALRLNLESTLRPRGRPRKGGKRVLTPFFSYVKGDGRRLNKVFLPNSVDKIYCERTAFEKSRDFVQSAMSVLKLPSGEISIWTLGNDDKQKEAQQNLKAYLDTIQEFSGQYVPYVKYRNTTEVLPDVSDRGKEPTTGTRLVIGFKRK